MVVEKDSEVYLKQLKSYHLPIVEVVLRSWDGNIQTKMIQPRKLAILYVCMKYIYCILVCNRFTKIIAKQ